MWRWFKRVVLWLGLLIVVYQLWLFAWVLWYRSVNPLSTSMMTLRLAELRQSDPSATLKQKWLPYPAIAQSLKQAIIAAEDARFVDHEGFDWEGIQRAIEKNQKKGRFVAGGSTITQQLAKNLFLSPSRSLWRKGEEAIITLMIEALWSKERILEVYLNVIEWGRGVFGAEAAAQHYYRISAARLSESQAARLAAMVPNPRYYDKNRNAPGLRRKTAIILRYMGSSELP